MEQRKRILTIWEPTEHMPEIAQVEICHAACMKGKLQFTIQTWNVNELVGKLLEKRICFSIEYGMHLVFTKPEQISWRID